MTAIVYDSHILDKLITFHLDKRFMSVYHGRWDTYFISNDMMPEFFYMMVKSNAFVDNIMAEASRQAAVIKNSPLYSALDEK